MGRRLCSMVGMRRRFELSDELWAMIGPVLPPERGRQARPARDNREMVNAILWVLRTGAPWRDLPDYYPPWQSVYTRFSRWTAQGIWQGILAHLTTDADEHGFHIDGTIVRAHQDAHGARKGGARQSAAQGEVPRPRSTQWSTPSGGPSASP
jgi:transposase